MQSVLPKSGRRDRNNICAWPCLPRRPSHLILLQLKALACQEGAAATRVPWLCSCFPSEHIFPSFLVLPPGSSSVNPCRGLMRRKNQHHSVPQALIRRPCEEGFAIKVISPFSSSAKFPQGASLGLLLPQPHGAHFFFNAWADRTGNIKLSSFMPCSDLRHCASELISWISNQKGNWLLSLTALFHQDLPGRGF